jgi:hypothetical protein
MKLKRKKHKDEGTKLSSSCLRRVRVGGGGEDDNNLIIVVFCLAQE